ncbi:hypothetical protein LIER_34002 [Lithospermum erythrorhizon]|uniref:DUF4283 domain-containing protein n=1 Tax=Lithospermum erythrorhizon TaxID=34254 RepID=A0AAV3RZ39_LITER
MDAEILRELIRCSLTEEEARPALLEEEDLVERVIECESSVYPKVHTLKLGFISLQGFYLAMARAWNCKELRVSRVSAPILHIFFPNVQEKRWILDNEPWFFYNHLWCSGLEVAAHAPQDMEGDADVSSRKIPPGFEAVINAEFSKKEQIGEFEYSTTNNSKLGHLLAIDRANSMKNGYAQTANATPTHTIGDHYEALPGGTNEGKSPRVETRNSSSRKRHHPYLKGVTLLLQARNNIFLIRD